MDFFQNRDIGQLWLEDRIWLYETCLALKPRVAFETGTWMGGGSTFFISSALKEAGGGKLYTVEEDPNMLNTAVYLYHSRWSHLLPYVDFTLGDSVKALPQMLDRALTQDQPLDFVFLDSAQDIEKMRQEFEILSSRLRVGGVLMAHDWFAGKADAIKSSLSDKLKWDLSTIGDGVGNFERGSVGMAKAIKLA